MGCTRRGRAGVADGMPHTALLWLAAWAALACWAVPVAGAVSTRARVGQRQQQPLVAAAPSLRGGAPVATTTTTGVTMVPRLPLAHLWWNSNEADVVPSAADPTLSVDDTVGTGDAAAALPAPPSRPQDDFTPSSLASLLQDHADAAPSAGGAGQAAPLGAAHPGIISVALRRGIVGSRRQAALLLQLRMKQLGLQHHELEQHADHPDLAVLLEMGSATSNSGVNVPLANQLLQQKRLATYFGEVTIGNQAFKVLFDTGSCEFWVPSSTCPKETSPERCRKHHMFNAAADKHVHRFKSARLTAPAGAGAVGGDATTRDKLEINYLSGKIEGDLYTDTVHIGNLAVTNQVFGAAQRIDVPLLDDVDWDGILGLAYPSSELSRRGVEPLFDTVMKEHLVVHNVFGYYLGPASGMITLGGTDKRLIASGATFQWAPVVQRGYWTLGLLDVELLYPGGERFSTGVCKQQPQGYCPTIVDTGTYLVYGPRKILGDKLKDIQTTGCGSVASLPRLVLVLYGGKSKPPVKVELSPDDYTLKFRLPAANVPASECSDAQRHKVKSNDARCVPDCLTGIAPDDAEKEMFTLGQVFLRNFYTVFDRGNDRIGFARSAAPGVTHAL